MIGGIRPKKVHGPDETLCGNGKEGDMEGAKEDKREILP